MNQNFREHARDTLETIYRDESRRVLATPIRLVGISIWEAAPQGRLPQELRLRSITTLEEAKLFLREHYIQDFNRSFQVPAAQKGSAFLPRTSKDLDLIFSVQSQRTVNRDNTVSFQNLTLQTEPVSWRATLAGCTITLHHHLDGTLSLTYGPQRLGYNSARGEIMQNTPTARNACRLSPNAL